MAVRYGTKQQEGSAQLVVPLRSAEATDDARVGAKAANLAQLASAGFPVPEGVVLTTAAFSQFLAGSSIDEQSDRTAVLAAPFPAALNEVISDAVRAWGDRPLAVRSSGVAEDLPGASFAGQYESVLDVRGTDAVIEAVRTCWASAFSSQLQAYRASRQMAPEPLAVLIQHMVPADAAGVAFTANPVTSDRSETVVSAVRGLGERLVSGASTPDEWVVRGEVCQCVSAPEGAIDEGDVRAVHALARRVESFFGAPQDIEWAISGGTLYLVQARPITTLSAGGRERHEPIPVAVDAPAGYWERETTHYPKPLSPLMRSLFLQPINDAFRATFAESSMLLETIELREIGGWMYQRTVPPGGKDRPAPPPLVFKLLTRLMPPLRSRVRGCVAAVRADVYGKNVERWYSEWRGEVNRRVEAFRRVELSRLSDEDLVGHIEELKAFLRWCLQIHMKMNGGIALCLAEFAFACRDLFGWDDAKAIGMLSGLSGTSSEPARKLSELAQMARQRPQVLKELERIDKNSPSRLGETDPEFVRAFVGYQRAYCMRTLRYEVMDETLAELPELTLGLLRDQIVRNYDPSADECALEEARNAVVAEARALLKGRTEDERRRFERLLARAQRAYPVREEHGFYDTSMPLALLRYSFQEVGNRLVARENVRAVDDVFFLEDAEALKALRDGGDCESLVAQRRGERVWIEANPGPGHYGKGPMAPPSFAVLPPEARFAHEGVMWTLKRTFEMGGSTTVQTAGMPIEGKPASPGRYTGSVRVIRSEAEFHKIRAGDVLVCPITSPVWSILFPSIGALITDTGGMLSHSAIIAREYRIPGVVATGNATSVLRDGQNVTVDGTRGTVEEAITV